MMIQTTIGSVSDVPASASEFTSVSYGVTGGSGRASKPLVT
jgi:hypothetical protein